MGRGGGGYGFLKAGTGGGNGGSAGFLWTVTGGGSDGFLNGGTGGGRGILVDRHRWWNRLLENWQWRGRKIRLFMNWNWWRR